jgi:hypothetical protein
VRVDAGRRGAPGPVAERLSRHSAARRTHSDTEARGAADDAAVRACVELLAQVAEEEAAGVFGSERRNTGVPTQVRLQGLLFRPERIEQV